MSDFELFDWPDRNPSELLPSEPWERWEDAGTYILDESGYFRQLGERLAMERS